MTSGQWPTNSKAWMLAQLAQRLSALNQQLADVQAQGGNQAPEIANLQQAIADVQAQIVVTQNG